MADFSIIKPKPRGKRRIPDRGKMMAFLSGQGFGREHAAHLTPTRLLQMATRFGFFRRIVPPLRSFSKAQSAHRLS